MVKKKSFFNFRILSFNIADLMVIIGALFIFQYLGLYIKSTSSILTAGIIIAAIGIIIKLIDFDYY